MDKIIIQICFNRGRGGGLDLETIGLGDLARVKKSDASVFLR